MSCNNDNNNNVPETRWNTFHYKPNSDIRWSGVEPKIRSAMENDLIMQSRCKVVLGDASKTAL